MTKKNPSVVKIKVIDMATDTNQITCLNIKYSNIYLYQPTSLRILYREQLEETNYEGENDEKLEQLRSGRLKVELAGFTK